MNFVCPLWLAFFTIKDTKINKLPKAKFIKMNGKVVSINISEQKGTKKAPIEKAIVKVDYGIEGDAHSGNWHRQISLLAIESVRMMGDGGLTFSPGDFGENITTEGVPLKELPVGSTLKIGESVILEVTQIGKECHGKCNIYYETGDCIMPKEGIFAIVKEGGNIKNGENIEFEA